MEQKDEPVSNFDIGKELGGINAKLDNLIKQNTRIMLAMLAIIAATLGVRFVGSPAHTIVLTYATLFAGTFLLASIVFYWNRIPRSRLILRIGFMMFLFFSAICRVFVFVPEIELPPSWYVPTIDIFLTILAILLVVSVWKDKNY